MGSGDRMTLFCIVVFTADDLVAQGERFDVVCSLEVIEHVADVPAFLHSLTPLVKVCVKAVLVLLGVESSVRIASDRSWMLM